GVADKDVGLRVQIGAAVGACRNQIGSRRGERDETTVRRDAGAGAVVVPLVGGAGAGSGREADQVRGKGRGAVDDLAAIDVLERVVVVAAAGRAVQEVREG